MADNGGTTEAGGDADASAMSFRMRQIVQLIPEGVLLLDRSGRIIDGNAKAAEVLEIPTTALLGDELERLFLGARREDGRAFLSEDLPGRRALLSGVPQTGVTMVLERRPRPALWLEVDAIPLGSIEQDDPVVLVSFRDISEHRRADDAVRFQAGLLDAAGEAIIATDRDLRITYCNAGMERLIQRTRAETIGESVLAFIAVDRWADIERIEHHLVSGLVIRDFETVVRRADGTDVDVSVSVTCQTTDTGEPIGAIATIRDISERLRAARDADANAKRAADAERAAALEAIERAAADQANDEKTELLSRMSHQLRTPLNSVLGFAQLLEDAELDDPVDRRSVAQILEAGRRIVDLVDEVLEFTRDTGLKRLTGVRPSTIDLDRLAVLAGPGRAIGAQPRCGPRGDERELTILFVDDDPSHLRAVEAVVAARDHVHLVTATESRRGIELARDLQPDLLLLSAGLSDLKTRDALAELRAEGMLDVTCVMVVDAFAAGQDLDTLTRDPERHRTHPMDLGRVLTVIDGLATAELNRVVA